MGASQADKFRALGSFQKPFLPALVAGFALLYFLAAKLGIATSLPPEGIVVVWPANAVILLALLKTQPKHWWAFFLATIAAEIVADVPAYPLWAALAYGTVNFFEAALAAFLLIRFGRDEPVTGVAGFTRFLATGFVAAGAAALLGAAVYKIGTPELDYLHYWRVFWFGDALGLLVVGTSLLTLFRAPQWPREVHSAKVIEAAILSMALAGAIGWGFFTTTDIPRTYLVFPFLLWAAVRFGGHGASIAVLATIGSAIGSAVVGVGPFSFLSTVNAVGSLQSLSVVVALSTFFLAFTIEDFWRAESRLRAEMEEHSQTSTNLTRAKQELKRHNEVLDRVVTERTAELSQALAHNELLLKEIYHRVKNSLQMISAMIALQGRTVSAQELRQRITNQISAIAATYDIMHQMDFVETADLGPIISDLCEKISETADGSVDLSCVTVGEALVPAAMAVSLTLAINELVTNSIKHSSGQHGAVIRVKCVREGEEATISIEDNGPGFPADFDLRKAKSFGMRMARKVVAQAGGELSVAATGEGSRIEVRLPIHAEGSGPRS
jgi:two-component sensor histidine kinase